VVGQFLQSVKQYFVPILHVALKPASTVKFFSMLPDKMKFLTISLV